MIQIYCGDGKGKTTASMGLAVRAAGRGKRVVVAQFLKSSDSGERAVLESLPTVTVLAVPGAMKFTFLMDEAEKAAEQVRQTALFCAAADLADRGEVDLLVLDEMCAAVSGGMVPLEEVTAFLDRRPPDVEVVMTGRNPAPALTDRADYITEMKKIKHPFDQGRPARKGIEW